MQKSKNFIFKTSILALAISGVVNAEPLEEVVVTGELRSVEQLELANSVSVITEELIEARNAKSVSDLFNIAPNVNFAEGASRGRFIQIRGIGERSQFVNPINPSVGVMVDGIDFTGLSLGATTVDTAQVEIFRGPQGTQFGANALAGMINIVGNAPGEEVEGKLAVGAGNYGAYDYSASFSTPVSETVGWRIAAQKNVSDGYVKNTYLDRNDTNNFDEGSLRNQVTVDAGEGVTFDLISYVIDVDNGYDAFSLDNNRTTLSDQPGHDRQKTFAHSLKTQYTGSEKFDVEATISVAESDVDYGYDEDWTYREICAIDSDCAWWQYSTFDNYERSNDNATADLRFISKSEDSAISWVAGAYYRNQRVILDRTYTNNDPDGDFYSPIGEPEVTKFSSEFGPTQTALYGEVNIALADRLTAVVGARGEHYKAYYNDSNKYGSHHDENLWGGKAALEFEFSDSTMVYGLVSRGYKPGGFNTDPKVPVANREYNTEWLMNYELGAKGQWLNGALSGQFAYFNQSREDVQVSVFTAPTVTDFVIYLDNAAKGSNQGVEAEFNWQILDKLSLYSSLAWLDTKYTKFINFSHVDGVKDMSGRQQAHAPDYQYFIAAQYDVLNNLYFRVEFEGKNAFYFSDSHDVQSPSYKIVNARIGYDVGNASFSLWGKNLTDQNIETRGFYFSNEFGNDPRKLYAPEPYSQKGAPLTAGVSASYSF